jgi:hypothetical protein
VAVAWQSFASTTGEGTTPTVGNPSGLSVGDLLIWHINYEKGSDAGSGSAGTLTGGTLIRRDNQLTNVGQLLAWLIYAGGGLTAVAFSTGVKWAASISRITGHDPTTPIRAHLGTTGSSGAPNCPNLAGLTIGDLVLALAGNKKNSSYNGQPTGYSERYDNPNAVGLPSNVMATKTAAASSEDPEEFNPTDAAEWAAATIAIAPAAGAAATSYAHSRRDRELPVLVQL